MMNGYLVVAIFLLLIHAVPYYKETIIYSYLRRGFHDLYPSSKPLRRGSHSLYPSSEPLRRGSHSLYPSSEPLHQSSESREETFVPTTTSKQTWNDWDNYSTDYGNTREYWGEYVPGGGWTGSPYSPENNPSGIPMKARPKKVYRNINLGTASAEELSDLIRSDIMK